MSYIAVVGAGSWGTTLAALLAGKGHDVSLWVHEGELVLEMRSSRVNSAYLPGYVLPNNINVSGDLENVLKNARFIINAVPTQHIRGVFSSALPFMRGKLSLLSVSKGIEYSTLKRPSEVLKELVGENASVLSGPSFAKEVMAGMPTATTLASSSKGEALLLQELLNTNYFRVYTHEDVTGVEAGGALKNAIAIAAGIADGLRLGYNARAALITRGLTEITRLGVAMGASRLTFSGLSGIGDLVLTCTANLSRNYSFGTELARGKKPEEIMSSRKSVAEGVPTSRAAMALSEKYGVEMPITEQVYKVIFEGKSPVDAVSDLMGRALKREFTGE
jgi:glycerol-3-phosphate dehydrogenase (NAD(P)+)